MGTVSVRRGAGAPTLSDEHHRAVRDESATATPNRKKEVFTKLQADNAEWFLYIMLSLL